MPKKFTNNLRQLQHQKECQFGNLTICQESVGNNEEFDSSVLDHIGFGVAV